MKEFIKSKKKLIVIVLIIIAVLIAGKLIFDQVIASDFMISRMIEQRNERNQKVAEDLLSPDEINVVLVGTAGPMSPDVAQQSTAVFVGGQFLLFDAGDYAQKRMEQFNLPIESLDAVFLTHYHNDHIADLGEVMQRSYMLGREKELVVYGPTGVEDIVAGFNMAYTPDSDHRTDHHGEEIMPLAYQFATASEFDAGLDEAVVYEKDGVVVTAFKGSHPPIEPMFGYMIEYKGKKVVISGDTLITEALARYSESADLLVMDVMNYELVGLMGDTFTGIGDDELATIMYDIMEYHPDVNDVA
ncbi:MAG: MBL fold metallo-hydrolase, partial [Clostridia bacterium]|nr:MBL fold metallo-hydrolase [Clostridia bacterium]